MLVQPFIHTVSWCPLGIRHCVGIRDQRQSSPCLQGSRSRGPWGETGTCGPSLMSGASGAAVGLLAALALHLPSCRLLMATSEDNSGLPLPRQQPECRPGKGAWQTFILGSLRVGMEGGRKPTLCLIHRPLETAALPCAHFGKNQIKKIHFSRSRNSESDSSSAGRRQGSSWMPAFTLPRLFLAEHMP